MGVWYLWRSDSPGNVRGFAAAEEADAAMRAIEQTEGPQGVEWYVVYAPDEGDWETVGGPCYFKTGV